MTYYNVNSLENELSDDEWIRQSVIIPERKNSSPNRRFAEMTRGLEFDIGELGFEDTSIGGNRSINPRPQPMELTDPPSQSLLANYEPSGMGGIKTTMGMGQWYGEAINQNVHRIWLQFGIPEFNSLAMFFTSFYDNTLASFNNRGIVDDILYTIGKYLGYMVLWRVNPLIAVTSLIYPFVAQTIHLAKGRPSCKYYYMKPQMASYWSAVQVAVNAVAVNMGIAMPADENKDDSASSFGLSAADVATMNQLLPDIMRSGTGGIDVRAMATRYMRLAYTHHEEIRKIMDESNTRAEAVGKISDYLNKDTLAYNTPYPIRNMQEYFETYRTSTWGKGEGLEQTVLSDSNTEDSIKKKMDANAALSAITIDKNRNADKGALSWLTEHFASGANQIQGELREGSNFVSFITDWQPTINESFSNSSRQSDIAQSMNNTSSENRNSFYNLANGNLGDGIIATAIEGVIGSAKAFVDGTLETFGLSGLSALGGRAFIDMPEYWEKASANLATTSYSIPLRAVYGNRISVFLSVIIPYLMLLIPALPRSTGRNSYTSPFLVRLWDQGRTKVSLGMIESISVTRGTGNVGWNIANNPLGIDVNITIVSLDKLMHVPVINEVSISDYLGVGLMDEENNFTDYMATLASLGLYEQVYMKAQWRLKMARSSLNFHTSILNPNYWITGFFDTMPGSIIRAAGNNLLGITREF